MVLECFFLSFGEVWVFGMVWSKPPSEHTKNNAKNLVEDDQTFKKKNIPKKKALKGIFLETWLWVKKKTPRDRRF